MKRLRVLYRHYVIVKASGSTYCMLVIDNFTPKKYTTLQQVNNDVGNGHLARICTSGGAKVDNTIVGFVSGQTTTAFTVSYNTNSSGTFTPTTFTAASVYSDTVKEVAG